MPDVASPQAWARETAEKICAHEAANIDESIEQRSLELAALIRKSMLGIPAGMRAAYLDELDTHFPAALTTGRTESSAFENAESESAATTIQRRLPELSSRERGELLRQLLEGAFQASHSSGRLGRVLLDAARRPNTPAPGTPPSIDPDRMLRVLELYCEASLGLQRLAIELWREVASRKLMGAPVLASDSDLRGMIGRCLMGDAEVPPTVLEHELDRQRRAIAAAMAMLGPLADNYAQAILKPFAPESIAAQSPVESFSMFGSREAGYWKQFVRTWESTTYEQREAVLIDCLSKHLRTLNRSNP
jgi:hypothetical protein